MEVEEKFRKAIREQDDLMSFEAKPRRRVTFSNAKDEDWSNVDIQDDDSDEDLRSVLKRIKADSERKYRDNPDLPPYAAPFPRGRSHGYLTAQETIYLIIFVTIIVFIYVVNVYNVRQLERIKEKYGFEDVKKPTPEVWWRNSLMYYVYIRSFKDSDGDGIGDIKGLHENLDYFTDLGIETIILSSINESPMVDSGRDVSDFNSVARQYGGIDDLDRLLADVHKRGMRLILELVPNHTSRRHQWFQESRKGADGDARYHDYYIWHEGRKMSNGSRTPPSNWMSRYGGSAWSWDAEREEYYYHYFHSTMPDLNHRDPHVRQEVKSMFEVWLEKGIDGILLADIEILLEAADPTLDEPQPEEEEEEGITQPLNAYGSVNHMYTEHQVDIHEFLASWGEVVDAYTIKGKRKIVLLADVKDQLSSLMLYYHTGADAPLCRQLMRIDRKCGGHCIHDLVDSWMTHMPDDKDALWMLSDPNEGRLSRRKGAEYRDLLNMLLLLIPGAALTYYGEEIGMEETRPSFEETRDVLGKQIGPELYNSYSRDPARAPMQWSNAQRSGFTSATKAWLPIHPNFLDANVQTQKSSNDSSLRLYQTLARLRKQPAFRHGRIQIAVITDNIYSFLRFTRDEAPYFVAMNFGNWAATHDFTISAGVQYADLVAHAAADIVTRQQRAKSGQVDLEKLTLQPGEGVVVKLVFDLSGVVM